MTASSPVERPLQLTRGHLFALGALSLALAALAFFLGVSVGRRQVEVPEPVVRSDVLVPEEVRSGDLEVLLAKVEATQQGVDFPGSLPLSPPPVVPDASDGVPSSGWAIQVAVRADETDAQRLVETLRQAGLPAYRVAALVDGKPEQRVRISGYATEAVARAALTEIQARSGSAEALVVAAP